ncbi:MAG: hypothetical protein WA152_02270 [Microgenomates group bacterium]
MTTVINTPQPASDQSNGMGMIIGLVVLTVFGFLFFVYGLPAIRQMRVGTPQVNIPSSIDVNVKQAE